MGYSIYDYYGMANDLQNRYDAAKNAGAGQLYSNTPFKRPTATPAPQQTTLPQTTAAEATTLSSTGGNSIYDYDNTSGIGGLTAQGGGDEMPPGLQSAIMTTMTGYMPYGGLLQTGLQLLGGAIDEPFGGKSGKGAGFAKQAGSYGMGSLNLGGPASVAKGAFSAIIDLLTGNFFSPPGRLGDPLEDPYAYAEDIGTEKSKAAEMSRQTGIPAPTLMASNLFGGASYANEYAAGGLAGRGGPNDPTRGVGGPEWAWDRWGGSDTASEDIYGGDNRGEAGMDYGF